MLAGASWEAWASADRSRVEHWLELVVERRVVGALGRGAGQWLAPGREDDHGGDLKLRERAAAAE